MKILANKKLLIIPVILGVVIVLLFLINKTPSEVLRSNIALSDFSVNDSTPGSASASYMYFENYEQADKMADTIVIGDVVKVNAPAELVTGEATNFITGEKEPMSHVFTVSEIRVDKVIKGKYSPGEIIKIKQYGGAYNGNEYKIADEIYYKVGERYIFFLESYQDSPCMTINPYQGDMLIVNGKTKANNKIQFISDNVSEDIAENALREKVKSLKNKKENYSGK